MSTETYPWKISAKFSNSIEEQRPTEDKLHLVVSAINVERTPVGVTMYITTDHGVIPFSIRADDARDLGTILLEVSQRKPDSAN